MSSRFGPIRQIGYVVKDLRTALDHWTRVLGVGPFFHIERVKASDSKCRGVPTDAEFTIALGNSGDMQIELMQPLDEHPSIFREFLDSGREGMQHVAFWYDTPAKMDAIVAHAQARGYEIGQTGYFGEHGRFAFLMTEAHTGTVIELSEVVAWKAELFRTVAEAARDWDGTDPVRAMKRPS